MDKLQLPHNSREFSARALTVASQVSLWVLLISLVVVNVYARVNLTPSFWDKLQSLLVSPFNLANHQEIASLYWQAGLAQPARRELVFAQELFSLTKNNGPQVLGATTPLSQLSAWDQEQKDREQSYQKWQAVIHDKPDYRDGFIALTVLAYQLGNIQEAKSYLAQAAKLDPNNLLIEKMASLFKNQGK